MRPEERLPKEVPEECQSCEYKTKDLKEYRRYTRASAYLCNLCASTFAGSAQEYPDHYRGQKETLATICYVGNVLIEEIRKLRGPSS